eukprot:7317046-Prorocentrum_lima.AAC.1
MDLCLQPFDLQPQEKLCPPYVMVKEFQDTYCSRGMGLVLLGDLPMPCLLYTSPSPRDSTSS